MPGAIIGSMVSNEFCRGGTQSDGAGGLECKAAGGGQASDIYYVPKLSDEITKLGMIKGTQIYSFKSYEWEEKW
jgi:hypothetical protein